MKSRIILPIVILLTIVVYLFWERSTIKPMEIVFVGALIVVIGGLVGAYGTLLHNRSSSAKTDRIEKGVNSTSAEVKKVQEQNHELKQNSEKLTEKVDEQAKTIDLLRKENTELSSKLTSESLKIYNNLMGAGSVPVIFIFPMNEKSAKLIVGYQGDTPLYDVKINIKDDYLFDSLMYTKENLRSEDFSISVTIGDIFTNDGEILTINGDFSTDTRKYSINILTRNGRYSEDLIIEKNTALPLWKNIMKVRDSKDNVVFEIERDSK